MPYFWTNTIWFILLGLSTLWQLAYIFPRVEKRKRLFAFFLTASGFGFVAEANLLMVFKAYNYYPMLVSGSTINDSLAGNLFSQFSVAATAVIITVNNLDYRWYVLFAGAYCLIEEMFLALGIYQHNWYQTWMTFGLMLIYFPLVKRLYGQLNQGLAGLWYGVYLFLGIWPFHFIFSFWPFMIAGKVMFYADIFADPLTNSTLLMVANYVLLYIMMAAAYFAKTATLWRLAAFPAAFLKNYLEYKLQLMYVEDGWFFIYSAVTAVGMLFYIYLLDSWYNEGQSLRQ